VKQRHIALIVEDHKETAEDLVEILSSIDCDTIVVDNHDAALIDPVGFADQKGDRRD